MCEQSICKVQIYRNEICLSYRLHTNYTMLSTVGGVDITLSKFNHKIKVAHVQCVNNHNTKFEDKGMKTA